MESDVSVSLQLGKGTATKVRWLVSLFVAVDKLNSALSIKGLEAGIVGVKEGGHRLVCVPSALAYGRQVSLVVTITL